jgi:hypothetical protein
MHTPKGWGPGNPAYQLLCKSDDAMLSRFWIRRHARGAAVGQCIIIVFTVE